MTTRGFRQAALAIFFFLLAATAAQAEKRLALVIGNAHYADAPLLNPVNDAMDVARRLRECGFEVMLATDANQRRMKEAIRQFGQRLRHGGVGLFYFAGHGLQIKGRNYLIPVGAVVTTESEVEYEAVDAGRVLAMMEAAANEMNLVILDACRNNPFARSFRSPDHGLAKMDAPKGSFLAYATAPGSTAADGQGRNGLYTEKLLKHMGRPGLKIEDVFKQVRIDVAGSTDSRQIPWESSSLMGDFFFQPPGAVMAGSASHAVPPQGSPDTVFPQEDEIRRKWGRWQAKMAADYDAALAAEADAQLTDAQKAATWDRFLAAYAADNPFDEKDEALRAAARQQMTRWQSHALPAASVPRQKPGLLDQIRQRGELRIGLESNYMPFEMKARNGRLVGFDIDLAQTLANDLGVRLTVVDTAWDGIIPAMLAGKFDVLLSGMTITPGRQKVVDFSNPYIVVGQAVLLRQALAAAITTADQLNRPEFTVASVLGTTGEQATRQSLPRCRYRAFENEAEAARAVVSGQADAVVHALSFCLIFAAKQGAGKVVLLDGLLTEEPLGIAIPKGNSEMRQWLNHEIAAIRSDGRYEQIYNQWFRSAEWIAQIP